MYIPWLKVVTTIEQIFGGGGETVRKENNSKTKIVNRALDMLNSIAVRNANSACRGFIYEPKVPKKLIVEK